MSSGVSREERAGRGRALPADVQGHHGAEAAHRGGLQGRAEQVRQAGALRHPLAVCARLAALEPGLKQGGGEAVQPNAGKTIVRSIWNGVIGEKIGLWETRGREQLLTKKGERKFFLPPFLRVQKRLSFLLLLSVFPEFPPSFLIP